jgi:hypothetical protein
VNPSPTLCKQGVEARQVTLTALLRSELSKGKRESGMEPSEPDPSFVAAVSNELTMTLNTLSLLAETIDGEEDVHVVDRLASRVGAEAERLALVLDDLRGGHQS